MGEFLPQSLVEDSLVWCTEEDGVTVASVGCQTIREWQAAMIRQRLDRVVGQSGGRVALSLAGVTGVQSGFFRDLIQLTDKCAAMGGRMVIYGLAPELDSVVRAAGFDAKLTVAESREEAVDGIAHLSSVSKRHGILGRIMGRRAA